MAVADHLGGNHRRGQNHGVYIELAYGIDLAILSVVRQLRARNDDTELSIPVSRD
jgi:hypothetical protein